MINKHVHCEDITEIAFTLSAKNRKALRIFPKERLKREKSGATPSRDENSMFTSECPIRGNNSRESKTNDAIWIRAAFSGKVPASKPRASRHVNRSLERGRFSRPLAEKISQRFIAVWEKTFQNRIGCSWNAGEDVLTSGSRASTRNVDKCFARMERRYAFSEGGAFHGINPFFCKCEYITNAEWVFGSGVETQRSSSFTTSRTRSSPSARFPVFLPRNFSMVSRSTSLRHAKR